jgi:hypothetical protein
MCFLPRLSNKGTSVSGCSYGMICVVLFLVRFIAELILIYGDSNDCAVVPTEVIWDVCFTVWKRRTPAHHLLWMFCLRCMSGRGTLNQCLMCQGVWFPTCVLLLVEVVSTTLHITRIHKVCFSNQWLNSEMCGEVGIWKMSVYQTVKWCSRITILKGLGFFFAQYVQRERKMLVLLQFISFQTSTLFSNYLRIILIYQCTFLSF